MILDHAFRDRGLLEAALTHASFANENGGQNQERLEFLGDAVLQLAATAWLTERFPSAPEGDLSRLRQLVVNTQTLAEVAAQVGVDRAIRLGTGEEQSGGRTRASVLAGAVEAVLGAVFLDGGYDRAERVVRAWLGERIEALAAAEIDGWKDPRNLLQERTQRDLGLTPVYDVVSIVGPPHAPVFEVEVRVGEGVVGRGRGPSKREASRAAAADANDGTFEARVAPARSAR